MLQVYHGVANACGDLMDIEANRTPLIGSGDVDLGR